MKNRVGSEHAVRSTEYLFSSQIFIKTTNNEQSVRLRWDGGAALAAFD